MSDIYSISQLSASALASAATPTVRIIIEPGLSSLMIYIVISAAAAESKREREEWECCGAKKQDSKLAGDLVDLVISLGSPHIPL